MEVQLRSALRENKKVEAQLKSATLERLEQQKSSSDENNLLKEKVGRLEKEITELESRKLRLSYNDLYPGGTLAGLVKEFTFFPTVECNDKFLALINFSDETRRHLRGSPNTS